MLWGFLKPLYNSIPLISKWGSFLFICTLKINHQALSLFIVVTKDSVASRRWLTALNPEKVLAVTNLERYLDICEQVQTVT